MAVNLIACDETAAWGRIQATTWGHWLNGTGSVSATSVTNTMLYTATTISSAVTQYHAAVWHQWHTRDEETKAQREARQRRMKTDHESQAALWAERRAQEAEAKGKARTLLVEHLSRKQRADYEARGYFDVELAGKTYRIHQGTHGNVRLLGAGVGGPRPEITRYCAQPNGVPAEDAMLAQKLMLETDEAAFLRVANASPLNY